MTVSIWEAIDVGLAIWPLSASPRMLKSRIIFDMWVFLREGHVSQIILRNAHPNVLTFRLLELQKVSFESGAHFARIND